MGQSVADTPGDRKAELRSRKAELRSRKAELRSRKAAVPRYQVLGSSAINFGITSKRSPTMATSASCIIGASGSLLIAMM